MAGKIVEWGAKLENKSYTCNTIVCGRQCVKYLHGRCSGVVGGGGTPPPFEKQWGTASRFEF